MSEPTANLSRRELLGLLIGAHATAYVGCSTSSLPIEGQLLSPEFVVGHRIRDGFKPMIPAGNTKQPEVVIVGGGIAGLTAAWRLLRGGINDFVLLEIEAVPGGTARGGRFEQFAFPWGAHYVPTPLKENALLVNLLTEMKVVTATNEHGEPIVAEQYLCREPHERVFADGQWFEGLYPFAGASHDDLQQLHSFRRVIDEWISRRDELGRRMFAIPISTASDCDEVTALDKISMSDWMHENGWTSPRLRWLVDYSCRDDYGLTIEQTSAWAGLFYFGSRTQHPSDPSPEMITFPEGNAAIVKYLSDCIGDRIRYSHAVYDIQVGTDTQRPIVSVLDYNRDGLVMYKPNRVIFAAPQFVAPYLIRDFEAHSHRSTQSFRYGSWLVANVHLRDRPTEKSMPMCWDNVIYGSKSLGYVTSTHQTGLDHGATVITWYYPLTDDGKVSRQQLLSLSWNDWSEMIVADLRYAHPDIEPLISTIDIMRWGHAMIQPRPGFVWSDARRDASKPFGRIHFANTDLSGIALLEEAFAHGVRAADEILGAGHPPDNTVA